MAAARILVVDDESNHVRVLSIALRLEGFEVHTASSATSAALELSARPTDLAIVDLMMPGTNGIELARQIRSAHPKTRVILTSAYHLSEHQLERADCGVVGFVPKPYALADLIRFIQTKLGPTSCPSLRVLGAGNSKVAESADAPGR